MADRPSFRGASALIRGAAILLAAAAGAALPGGCSGKEYEIKTSRPTPIQSLLTALKSHDPDIRYRALLDLGKSKALNDDLIVKAVKVIAETDANPLVRAQALHLLDRVSDERVVPTVLIGLDDPDPRVRTAAANILVRLPYAALEVAKLEVPIRKKLITQVTEDGDLDVRIAVARALGKFRHESVLSPLIAALRDPDFAVRYHAHRSLVELTGQDFGLRSPEWLKWTKETPDPFKDAGSRPGENDRGGFFSKLFPRSGK